MSGPDRPIYEGTKTKHAFVPDDETRRAGRLPGRRSELFDRAARVAKDVGLEALSNRCCLAEVEPLDRDWTEQFRRDAAMYERIQGLDMTGTAVVGRRLCDAIVAGLVAIETGEVSDLI